MGNMVWREAYSVGNAMLDEQHRGLLDLVNRIEGFAERNESPGPAIAAFLDEFPRHRKTTGGAGGG